MKARVSNIAITPPFDTGEGWINGPVTIELQLFEVNYDMLNNIHKNMQCYIYDNNRDRKGLWISSGKAENTKK